MFDRAILAAKRCFLLGSLWFSGLLTVSAARATLSKLAPAVNPEPARRKQLLADVSVIARKDAGTGIQRVVRELLRQLVAHPPPGYEVRPVYATRWRGFRYADSYLARLMGMDVYAGSNRKVQVGAGDIFLGMDFAAHILPRHHVLLGRWKAAGVSFFFIIYDLLPVLRPEWFTASAIRAYRRWIRTVAIFADGAVCISRSVADDLKQWSADTYGKAISQSIPTTWFYLSGDISTGTRIHVKPAELNELLERISKRPAILMVGTVEPRKGYAQALGAFERLWQNGRDINLVIVGKPGWKVAGLIQRLRSHPEAGNRLIWIENTTDELLRALYVNVDGLLMASEGEGFGLPIAEAAQFNKPVLCRDIPVFRETAAGYAQYFVSGTPTEMASDIMMWLDSIDKNKVRQTINHLSWKESAQQLLKNLPAI